MSAIPSGIKRACDVVLPFTTSGRLAKWSYELDRVNAFVKMLTDGCSGMQADYVPLSTKTPFVKGLTEYLSRRATGVG